MKSTLKPQKLGALLSLMLTFRILTSKPVMIFELEEIVTQKLSMLKQTLTLLKPVMTRETSTV